MGVKGEGRPGDWTPMKGSTYWCLVSSSGLRGGTGMSACALVFAKENVGDMVDGEDPPPPIAPPFGEKEDEEKGRSVGREALMVGRSGSGKEEVECGW